MATIGLDGLTVRLGDREVLQDVDLDVMDGELLVVAGPSGSGKTTLLRTIAGFEKPVSGRVLIDGEDVAGLPPGRRDLAMVFQEYALYSNLDAGKNIEFPLVSRGVKPQSERDRRVRREARSFDIEQLLDRMPGELSMGHRQAVSTARSMVRDSKALLMDEPLSNLDARSRDRARVEVRRMHDDVGSTIVYVTNDQTEAMSIGTRVAVLDEGRLQQVARPMELYRAPVNTMVAGFIGTPSMRFVAGELATGESGIDLLVGTDRLALGDRPDLVDVVGRPVTVGIRPGDLAPSRGETPFERCLHGRVTHVVDQGSDAFATVDLGRGESSLLARLRPGDPHRPGATIELTLDPDVICFFDPVTGEARGGGRTGPSS
ncbi:MAG: ABC transporter ATP-binding protein [Acidimicrobiia bacterium]|nr:ABC transporter ATP-binding protein [Acidimicrobiia bacterium]